MEKTPACLAAMLGTVYGGDFYTVIDTKMPWDRIRKIFSVLKPAAIITDRDHEETVREALASERKDSPKILLYEKAMYVPEDREGWQRFGEKQWIRIWCIPFLHPVPQACRRVLPFPIEM